MHLHLRSYPSRTHGDTTILIRAIPTLRHVHALISLPFIPKVLEFVLQRLRLLRKHIADGRLVRLFCVAVRWGCVPQCYTIRRSTIPHRNEVIAPKPARRIRFVISTILKRGSLDYSRKLFIRWLILMFELRMRECDNTYNEQVLRKTRSPVLVKIETILRFDGFDLSPCTT